MLPYLVFFFYMDFRNRQKNKFNLPISEFCKWVKENVSRLILNAWSMNSLIFSKFFWIFSILLTILFLSVEFLVKWEVVGNLAGMMHFTENLYQFLWEKTTDLYSILLQVCLVTNLFVFILFWFPMYYIIFVY
jgi:hypothetical protein